jgi:hypothetical protein
MDLTDFSSAPASGPLERSCGDCTLCCKVYNMPELEKSAGQWCRHCVPGQGCGIHDTRPEVCRAFFCLWIRDDTLPDYWKPNRSKMVLSPFPGNGFIYVQVDPGQPKAWMREPYRSDLARLSKKLLAQRLHVLVFVNDEATLIMEDQAIPLGKMRPQDGFKVQMRPTPQGMRYFAERVPAKDAMPG